MYISKFKKANKVFTDRVEPKEYLSKEIKNLKELDNHKKIVNFYGIGGIGKTRFLKEMRYENKSDKKDPVSFMQVSFDTYEFDTPIKIILSMRKQLNGIDFTFFDYAIIQYYVKNGLNTNDILKSINTLKSGIFDTLITVSETGAQEFIPFYGLAKNIAKTAKQVKDYVKFKKFEKYFKVIEELDANEIYKLLPKMLADGINRANRKVIFFLDDFESMAKRIKDMSISDDALIWLVSFFDESKDILLVVSSRDKLNVEKYPSIAKYTEQYYLDKLTIEDAKSFLRTIPINDDRIIDEIAQLSEGIPLYLDMCADLYVSGQDFDFKNLSMIQIIDRYLRHLGQTERELIYYLSYLNTFEIDFIIYLTKAVNMSISEVYLKDFLEISFFNDVDEYKKIDSSVKAHIFAAGLNSNNSGMCKILRKYLLEKITIDNKSFINYFNQLIYLMGESGRKLNREEIEDIGYLITRLVERGYGNNIKNNVNIANKNNEEFKPIYNYFNLLYLRRIGKLKEAIMFYENIKSEGFDSNVYGNLTLNYELIYIQSQHLNGNSNYAISRYKEIIADYEMFGADHIKLSAVYMAKIKYADLMFLKGEFNKSFELINKIDLNKITESEVKMEVLRVKGHIFRFNEKYDKAIKVYDYILNKESHNNLKIIGNVYNNLAETYAYVDCDIALKYAQKSIELNEVIGSKVEVGKSLSAKAIALGRMNEFKKAIDAADEALEIQKEANYQGGIIIALYDRIMLEYLKEERDQDLLKKYLKEIKEVIDKTGIYEFLCVRINKMANEEIFKDVIVDWLVS